MYYDGASFRTLFNYLLVGVDGVFIRPLIGFIAGWMFWTFLQETNLRLLLFFFLFPHVILTLHKECLGRWQAGSQEDMCSKDFSTKDKDQSFWKECFELRCTEGIQDNGVSCIVLSESNTLNWLAPSNSNTNALLLVGGAEILGRQYVRFKRRAVTAGLVFIEELKGGEGAVTPLLTKHQMQRHLKGLSASNCSPFH